MDDRYCGDPSKYLRHLMPLAFTDWDKNILPDLVEVCADEELPKEFRDELKGELLIIKEETERLLEEI
jgi:hypothetical protein